MEQQNKDKAEDDATRSKAVGGSEDRNWDEINNKRQKLWREMDCRGQQSDDERKSGVAAEGEDENASISVGFTFWKLFDDGKYYEGSVKSGPNQVLNRKKEVEQTWHVVFDDETAEDLTEEEIMECVVGNVGDSGRNNDGEEGHLDGPRVGESPTLPSFPPPRKDGKKHHDFTIEAAKSYYEMCIARHVQHQNQFLKPHGYIKNADEAMENLKYNTAKHRELEKECVSNKNDTPPRHASEYCIYKREKMVGPLGPVIVSFDKERAPPLVGGERHGEADQRKTFNARVTVCVATKLLWEAFLDIRGIRAPKELTYQEFRRCRREKELVIMRKLAFHQLGQSDLLARGGGAAKHLSESEVLTLESRLCNCQTDVEWTKFDFHLQIVMNCAHDCLNLFIFDHQQNLGKHHGKNYVARMEAVMVVIGYQLGMWKYKNISEREIGRKILMMGSDEAKRNYVTEFDGDTLYKGL